jgi:transcriptional regulator with XRE-family HTH domain
MAYYFHAMTKTRTIFFGDRLRTLRIGKGLTQTELGKRVGLSGRMMVHYEKHATRPPVDKVVALARALGLQVADLVNGNSMTDAQNVDRKFARRLERARRLPAEDQKILAGIIDGFLQKNGLGKKRPAAKATS